MNLASLIVVLLSFVLAFWSYPQMPERMASHWGLDNQVNGYMPKFWGVFMMPLLSVLLYGLFLIIPRIDPKKANIAKFKHYFDTFIFIMLLFLLYLYKLTILWNLDYQFNLGQWVVPGIAVVFFYVGVLLGHTEPNWFIGIRTPWTLSNEKVWRKTHQLGGLLFKIVAIVSLLSFLVPQIAYYIVIGGAVGVALFLFIYSYYLFKKV